MMLVYGDGNRAKEAVQQLYKEVHGRAPYAPEDPYYRGFQAYAINRPREGEQWQLADAQARQVTIMEQDTTSAAVKACWIRPIGYKGAPAFFPIELPASAFDGARPWKQAQK